MQYNDETFWKHEYNLTDHLGNVHVVFAAHSNGQPEVMQQTSYYPFGMTLQQQEYGQSYQANRMLYNGKELQDDELAGVSLDWYDYGARFYDAQIGRWHVVDPMADEREWLSPYNYVQNNPIYRIDPTGALDDGYQDMQGKYKWFDDATADVIGREEKIWIKITDNKNIFNMAAAGILDNIPEPTDPGQITETDNITSFEMWLDSPSESLGEGVGKIGANISYSIINSPSILLTGKSLGGTEAISQEKMEAFIDAAPAVISFGMTKTKEVVKVTGKSLQGYNQFKNKSGISFSGKGWQQRASQLFKSNKVNQSALDGLNLGTFGTGAIDKTKDELKK